MALTAGYQAALDTWTMAGREGPPTLPATRRAELQELWARYNSTTYGHAARARALKGGLAEALYRHTRDIFNPVPALVDFYSGVVYPGRLRGPTEPVPPGVPEAIPLGDDTPPEVVAALCQWWEWAGWQSEKAVYVRYGAAQGSVLLEVVDDWERGRVSADLWRADQVADVTLDRAGNPKSYTLEYPAADAAGRFTYQKSVDQETIRTYRNGQPSGFDGQSAVIAHPYGFCPARWARHRHNGDAYGAAAISGSLGLIDELNSIASMAVDLDSKRLDAPMLIKSEYEPKKLGAAAKRGATDELSANGTSSDRESISYWHVSDEKADVMALWPMMGGDDATMAKVEALQGELERRHPELALWQHMREMSQVTGPGAARLVGDVTARVQESASEYDRQLKAAAQMALAIGGMRFAEGAAGWARKTRQQQRFAGFDLASWERGDLDFTILPRPLLPSTDGERAGESLAWFNAAKAAGEAGLPLETFLMVERGWTQEQVATLTVERLAAIRREQLLASEDVPPTVQQ